MDRTTTHTAPGEATNPPMSNAAWAPPFRWSAIFAGSFVALGITLILTVLGFAGVVSSLNPENPTIAGGAAIGLGIWLFIVPLFSLFFGGWTAARGSRLLTRTSAGLHGAVVWALYQVVTLFFAGAMLTGILGGIAGMAGQPQIGSQLGATLIGAGIGALWGIFASMVLSLLTAVLGGLVGFGRRERRERREPVPVQRPAESRA